MDWRCATVIEDVPRAKSWGASALSAIVSRQSTHSTKLLVTAVRASALGNRLFELQNTRNATLKILSSPSKHLGILHHDILNLLGDGVKLDASCAVTIAPQPKVTPAIPHICQPTNSAHDLRWSSSISSQSSPRRGSRLACAPDEFPSPLTLRSCPAARERSVPDLDFFWETSPVSPSTSW
jgi:hypothetical protein